MTGRQGGCQCGKLRFEMRGEPRTVAVCHCRDCQKQTGSAFALVVVAPQDQVGLSGADRTFVTTGDSGRPVERHFCPDCGSPVFMKVTAVPDALVLMGGAFDDVSWLRPGLHFFCDSAQPWLTLPENAKKFPRLPGGAG